MYKNQREFARHRKVPFIRKVKRYSVDTILDLARNHKGISNVTLDGDLVDLLAPNIEMFLKKGTNCVNCGLKGQYFIKTRKNLEEGNWRLMLFGIYHDGTEVLMTRDHIIPRCDNGPDTLENIQPMCWYCNYAKGNKYWKVGQRYPVADVPKILIRH